MFLEVCCQEPHEELVDKASDLEGRSRRNNVIFYYIPEPSSDIKEPEDCDAKIMSLLKTRGFFEADYTLEIDRAHRLGKKRQGIQDRPRPVIVRFSFFKDKEQVIKNGKLLKGSNFVVSEDFSKITLEIHRQLRNNAKEAKTAIENDDNQNLFISYYKVTYRRVVLTYKTKQNPNSAPVLTRSFHINFINSNINWYKPPARNTYRNVQNQRN